MSSIMNEPSLDSLLRQDRIRRAEYERLTGERDSLVAAVASLEKQAPADVVVAGQTLSHMEALRELVKLTEIVSPEVMSSGKGSLAFTIPRHMELRRLLTGLAHQVLEQTATREADRVSALTAKRERLAQVEAQLSQFV